MPPVLVLGVGNILLRDEGVGVHVVQALRDRKMPDGVEVVDGGTFGLDLIDIFAGRRKVIFIDAMLSKAPPATVLRFSPKDLVQEYAAHLSLHDVNLSDTLTMAEQLGCAPEEVIIFGIVPKDMSPGLELSAEVAAVVPEVIRMVLAEIAEGK